MFCNSNYNNGICCAWWSSTVVALEDHKSFGICCAWQIFAAVVPLMPRKENRAHIFSGRCPFLNIGSSANWWGINPCSSAMNARKMWEIHQLQQQQQQQQQKELSETGYRCMMSVQHFFLCVCSLVTLFTRTNFIQAGSLFWTLRLGMGAVHIQMSRAKF